MENIETFFASQTGLIVSFIAVAMLVVVSGIRLSIYGDALGDRTGLGSGLIGLVFLAAVTSLPELVVSLTSVLKAEIPQQGADLAVGNMLGSNVFNLLILALLVIIMNKKFIPEKLESSHMQPAIYGLIMLFIFALAFSVGPHYPVRIPFIKCSLFTLLLPVTYGFILRRENKQRMVEVEEILPSEEKVAHMPALRFYSILSLLCLLIVGGGIMLSILGSRMSLPPEQGGFGLEASLIGTLFLAVSTSLPELVISFSSVRMGFLDMSVGNVLGSNMFNLLIIFAADVGMRSGSILRFASKTHWISVGLIFIMTVLTIVLLKSKGRILPLLISFMMLGAYIISLLWM